MAISLNINGQNYLYPEVGDVAWGPDATDWSVAVTSGMLQKAGGLFQLLAEADFGSSYGLKSIYYKSRTTNPAVAGQIRLARVDTISWRNEANDADLALSVDSGNNLLFNGAPVGTIVTVSDTNSIDLNITGTDLTADLKLSATGADPNYTAVDLIVETDGLRSQISDAAIRAAISVTDTSTIDLTYSSGVLSADIIAGSISNSLINASAAIAFTKMAAMTASRAVVSDASGFLVPATTTATEIGYVNGVTSSIQTQLNTKLTNPLTTTGDIIYSSSGSTPARLGIGTAGQVLTADPSGVPVWGPGSSGGINYITNGQATSNTSGWATYANTPQTTPVNGTGGSPSITFTRNTSSPLRPPADFQLTKGAANRQGEGVSYAFTIDNADTGKTLQISCDINSSANYVAGDMGVYIYDVTNSTLITPSFVNIAKASYTFQATFVATSSTSYRLIFHIQTTSALAYNLFIDNVSVGPNLACLGVPVSGPTDVSSLLTFSANFGTVTNKNLYMERMGPRVRIFGTFRVGSVSAAAAPIGFSGLGLTIATSYYTNDQNVLGALYRVKQNAGAATIYDNTCVAFYEAPDTQEVEFGRQTQSGAIDRATAGGLSSSDYAYLDITFIAAEYLGSAAYLSQAQPEYAYNTDVSATPTVTTNTAIGAVGINISSNWVVGTTYTRRVTFTTPIQVTDDVFIEFDDGNSGPTWSSSPRYPVLSQGTNNYGARLDYVAGGYSADIVFFNGGRLSNNATYAGNGASWASDSGRKWRVVKVPGTVQVAAPSGTSGSGTVTSVSVVTANGFSGSVANSTTTPAITLTLGSNAVANSQLAQMPTLTIKGNNTGGTANAADLTAAQVTAILNVFTTSLQGLVPASGGGTTNFLRADGTWAAPGGGGSGDVVGPSSATDNAIARFDTTTGKLIQNSVVTIADSTGDMAGVGTLSSGEITSSSLTASRVLVAGASKEIQASSVTTTTLGYLDATSSIQTQLNGKQASGNYITALTGDVTASGPGSVAATIASKYKVESITITIQGINGGISTGLPIGGSFPFPYACTITDWTIIGNTTGSIVVDIKRSTYSGFPTTTSIVGGGNKPTLSAAQKNTATPSGWTSTAIVAGDMLEAYVDSVSTLTSAVLMLTVTRT